VQEAFEGIYAKFAADPILSGAVTNMYFDVAPPQTAFPYIVYSLVSSVPKWVFPARAMEDMLIQFNIFSDEDAETEASRIYGYLRDCFDNTSLTVCGYGFVMMQRTSNVLMKADNVWMYNATYRLMAQQT